MDCRKLILRKRSEARLNLEEKLAVEEALGVALSTLDIWSSDYGAYGFFYERMGAVPTVQSRILAELALSLSWDADRVSAEFVAICD